MNPVVTENFIKAVEVVITQQIFACSKSAIETIEKDVKHVQSFLFIYL